MAEIYVTRCPLCDRQFKTRKALETHYIQKHPGNDVPQSIVFASGEKQAPMVKSQLLKECDEYLEWLAELVECINSAHNPSVPGKYYFQFLIKTRSSKLRRVAIWGYDFYCGQCHYSYKRI